MVEPVTAALPLQAVSAPTAGTAGQARRAAPLFSVITAAYRSCALLQMLQRSLAAQSCQDFEWVVIDGGSQDGTVEQLCRWQAGQAEGRLVWHSGPDRGIYDALNRGIRESSGRYLLFMGADDALADAEVLADLAGVLRGRAEADWPDALLGDVEVIGTRICRPRLDWHMRVRNAVHHQGAFYARHLFDDFQYDIEQKIGADYELNLLLHLRRADVVCLPRLISRCGAEGVSNRTREALIYTEFRRIRRRHLSLASTWGWWLIGYVNLVRRRLGW